MAWGSECSKGRSLAARSGSTSFASNRNATNSSQDRSRAEGEVLAKSRARRPATRGEDGVVARGIIESHANRMLLTGILH